MAHHAVQQYRRSSSDSAVFRMDIPVTNDGLLENTRRRHPRSVRIPNINPRQSTLPESPRPVTPDSRVPLEKEKIPVQAPSSLLKFFTTVVLLVCRFYLHFPIHIKAPVYLISVFILSAAGDLLRPTHRTYLSQPDNAVSQWFVNYADFWTFVLLGTYTTITTYFYTGGKRSEIFRNLSRISIALAASLCIKFVFGSIRHVSGFCSNDEIRKHHTCLREGHRWMSFDPSEEAFFLVYHPLIIMEEVKNFKRWEALDFSLLKDPWNVLLSPEQTARNVVFAKRTYGRYSGVVKFLFFILTILCALWDVMLAMTSLYSFNLPQKFCGSIFACLIWFFTYQLWYPITWPGLAGIGIFRELPGKR